MKQSFYKIKSNYSLLPLRGVGGFLIWLLPLCLSAQTSTQNYIVTTVPYQKVSDPTTLTDANSNSTIQYFDGLGRPSQTVQRAIAPAGADLVSGIRYDDLGRDYQHWLPGKVVGNNGAYVTDFGTPAVSSNGDASPYATIEYDGSPLNRVTGQYGAGVDWYNNTKKKTIAYTTNDSNVKHYYVDGTQLKCDGFYSAATLYGQKNTDEDGKTVEEFTDKQGRKVLSRVAGDHDTYYVYDDLDNLCYVLPPLAADAMGASQSAFSESAGSTLYNYGYIYHYDGQKRCTEKKLPGCDWIYMVYDLADRLILSQDGNQRLKAQWTVNKYDSFKRLLYSGLINDGSSRSGMEANYSGSVTNESYTGSGPVAGYTSANLTPSTLLTVNYYDSYSFISNSTLNYDSSQEANGYTPQYSNAKGLLTGTRVYHLDNPSLFETTALYYDKYGCVVQTRATNHLGGYDIAYNALDFTGKPTRTYKTHGINGASATITELYTYDYNKAQQPTTTTYSLNGGGAITLVANGYDELGRLTTKKRHSNADTESYAYNVRNWVTNITSGGFAENLYYNANPMNSNATYNGNISYSTWTYNNATKGYLYEYDGLNRLLSSNFKQVSSGLGDDSFNEAFTYDKMGNILTLKRKKNYTPIDDLVFHYSNNENSNQLQYVDDGGATQNQYLIKEYQNKSTAQAEFTYDANGNMTKDLDRDIYTIKYNVLNLPDVVQFKNGNQIKNSYNAGGQKLGTEYFTWVPGANTPVVNTGDVLNIGYSQGAIDQNGTVYIGNVECNTQNGNPSLTTISRIHNMEGYVENISSPNYYYYRKDHLGNNREVWLANTNTTKQWTQYYPSGLPWVTTPNDNLSTQPYKYNGKEFVEMHGYDTYDYGARGYYPATGRFSMSVDPLAEKYYSISPYVYCANNPVNFIDPDGEDISISYVDKKNKEQTWVFNGRNGKDAPDNEFVKSFVGAYNYNLGNGGGENMKEAATNSDLNIKLIQGDETMFVTAKDDSYSYIQWNPTDGIKSDEGYTMSPATCLEHEFDHGVSYAKDPVAYHERRDDDNPNSYDKQYENKEERRVITGSEARTARANYEYPEGYVRKNHNGGRFVTVPSSTSNGDKATYVFRWLAKHPITIGNTPKYKRTK